MTDEPLPEWRSRVYRRTLVMVVLCLCLLLLLALGVGFGIDALTDQTQLSLTEICLRADPKWIGLATLFVLLGTASHGPRMRPLLPKNEGRAIAHTRLGSLYLAASVLNLSFPGPAGELAAGVVLQKTHRIPASLVIAASLHARFVALLVSAVVTLTSLPFLDLPQGLRIYVYFGAGGLGIAGLALGLLSFYPRLFRRISELTFGRFSNPDGGSLARLFAKIHEQVDSFTVALRRVPQQGTRAYLVAGCWSLASLFVSFLAILCAARAFGLHPEPMGTFMTLCLTLIAAVALIIVPGGLGSFDIVLVTSLNATAGATWTEACMILWGVRLAQVLSIVLALFVFRFWARDFLRPEVLNELETRGSPP